MYTYGKMQMVHLNMFQLWVVLEDLVLIVLQMVMLGLQEQLGEQEEEALELVTDMVMVVLGVVVLVLLVHHILVDLDGGGKSSRYNSDNAWASSGAANGGPGGAGRGHSHFSGTAMTTYNHGGGGGAGNPGGAASYYAGARQLGNWWSSCPILR